MSNSTKTGWLSFIGNKIMTYKERRTVQTYKHLQILVMRSCYMRQPHCMFQDTCLVCYWSGNAGSILIEIVQDYCPQLEPDLITSQMKQNPFQYCFHEEEIHKFQRHETDITVFKCRQVCPVQVRNSTCCIEYIYSFTKRAGGGGASQESDDWYRFLRPIRGTPAFWQGAQHELVACVRQLGIPTLCSFSSAGMRWTNPLHSIEDLEWCKLLQCNCSKNVLIITGMSF